MKSMPLPVARRAVVLLVCATLYLSLSAFECASTEMTTAKVAVNAKDWAKAEDALKREVAARPQNSEAWILLAQVYETQNRYPELIDAFDHASKATQPPLKPEQVEAITVKRYNLWSSTYNDAADARASGNYPLAFARVDTAMMLRPSANESYYLQGLIALESGDTARQTKIYQEYARRVRPDLDRGLAAGIALGMTQAEVKAKLGEPTEGQMDTTVGGWAYFADKGLGVYYLLNKEDVPAVSGWKIVPADDPPIERRIPCAIQSDVFYTLGVDAFYAGETNKALYDDALTNFQLVERLDPREAQAGKIIAQIYILTGRTAEARKRYEKELADNPDDPINAINYGNFLINLNEYQGAIVQYQRAQAVSKGKDEERYQQALFNEGAAFKNWGAALQDSVRKAAGSKGPTKAQEEVYLAKLRESLKLFEALRQAKGASTDFGLLAELANLYQVLGDNAKMKSLLSSLEAMAEAQGQSASYWTAMANLYAAIGDGAKADAAFKKADAINAGR